MNRITDFYDASRAQTLKDDLSATPHYLFCSQANSADESTSLNYDKILYGQKIHASDLCPMVPKSIWQDGVIYDTYNGSNTVLAGNFFAAVQSGNNYFVYKCLDNNSDAAANSAPAGTSVSPVKTSDGYVWKYMYTFTSADYSKFATASLMPVFEDANNAANAVPGTIDVIRVDDPGSNYGNYFTNSFADVDIEVGGDDTKYALDPSASGTTGFYNGCILKILDGSNQGDWRRITDYSIVSGTKTITLDSAFVYSVDPGTSYEIMPAVVVQGDGRETETAVGRAIVQNGLITRVDMLDTGKNYRKATATVYADASVSVLKAAELTPVVSPPKGHGSDVFSELGAKYLGISVNIGNTLPTQSVYQCYGILRQPEFDNVKLTANVANQVGTFIAGENLVQFRGIKVAGSASVFANTTVTGSATVFKEAVEVGDKVLISDGIHNHFASVLTLANNTSLTLNVAPSWSNSSCSFEVVKELNSAQVKTSNTGFCVLGGVTDNFNSSYTRIVGDQSYTTSNIDFANTQNLTINTAGVNNFDTFVQLERLVGSFSSNTTFASEEVVAQGNTTAIVHHWDANTSTLYIYDKVGNFVTNTQVTSNTSAAVFVPTASYPGFLKTDSGHFVYIETTDQITRNANKSETIKLVLES